MQAGQTESLASSAKPQPRSEWSLVVALDCQALDAWPERFSLNEITELVIGRGTDRSYHEHGPGGRLELPDRWVSQEHAQLLRAGEDWEIHDCGSRNGTRVNGKLVGRHKLEPGDVICCGATFLVVRKGDAVARSPEELQRLPEALRTLSPSLARELELVERLAPSPTALLVLGESGTGKEGTAAAVHKLSRRAGPLVAVNCGGIPATLTESELFGSRRGAFSGAEERPGLVRTAHRGTLFLDEVAELPLASQAALLRVLQEREVVPVGSTQPIAVDMRLVAATNRPVATLLQEGKLRRDLYARLKGREVQLVPLRERLEDLGLLVAALLKRHGGGGRTLSRDAGKALFAYDWPLNVRELEQCLSSAAALAPGEIGLHHLPGEIRAPRTDPPREIADDREGLLELATRLGGNLSALARELGTSRTQVYRLMARHEIAPAAARSAPLAESPNDDEEQRPASGKLAIEARRGRIRRS